MARSVVQRHWIFIMCLITLVTISKAIYVHNTDGEILYFNTPAMRYGTRNFNITGAKLIVTDPVINFCAPNDQDFTDRIVIMSKDGCTPGSQMKIAKDQGAIGVIWVDFGRVGPAGNIYWRTVEGRWPDESTILPMVAMNKLDATTLIELLKNDAADVITADVDPFEYNRWKDLLDDSNQYLILAILIVAASLGGLGFALSRFVSLFMVQGCALTTAHFSLSFICLGFATMAIYYILNIIDIKMGPTAAEACHMAFVTAPELFSLLSCLIVSLYWFELINSVANRPILFLKKLFRPFIGIAVVVAVVWVFINVTLSLYLGLIPFLIFALSYLLVSLMITTVWIIVGIKLLKTVRANQKLVISAKTKKSFDRLAICIILCAIFLFATRLLYCFLVALPTLDDPFNWIICAGAVFFCQLASLYIQTGLFKMQKRDFKTSVSGDSNSHGDLNSPQGRANSTLELSSRVATVRSQARIDKSESSKSSSKHSQSGEDSGAEMNGNGTEVIPQQPLSEVVPMSVVVEVGDNNTIEDSKEDLDEHISKNSSSSSSSSSEESSSSSSEIDSEQSSKESYDKTDSS